MPRALKSIFLLAWALHGTAHGADCPTVTCEYATLYVHTQAIGPMDGTIANPFASLKNALTHADTLGFECVELRIAPGVYAEDVISISRNVRFYGIDTGVTIATPIRNLSPSSLEIKNVTMAPPAVPASAAIEAENQCANTTLQDVVIRDIEGQGVVQRGGSLSIENVTIRSTQRSGAPESGVGAYLSGGVDACVTNLNANNNESLGLYAADAATRVLIYDSRIDGNGGTENLDEVGGIGVTSGALVLGQKLTMDGNIANGILVTNGGIAHFRDAAIARTREAAPGTIAANTRVDTSSTLNLTSFSLCESDLAGSFIRGAGQNPAYFVAGLIADNPIGISLEGENLIDASACFSVQFRNNDINLDADELPEPQPFGEQACDNGFDDDLDGETDCDDSDCAEAVACGGGGTLCPEVNFSPSWCAVSLTAPTAPDCLAIQDADGDGVGDAEDRCPASIAGMTVDPAGCTDSQVDSDADGACDIGAPSTGPSMCAGIDNCLTVPNPDQRDGNDDGFGDACVPSTVDVPPGVGPGAEIGKGTSFAANVYIGTNLVCGRNVQFKKSVIAGDNLTVGSNTTIEKNAVLGNDVEIGKEAKLEEFVTVADRVVMGKQSVIKKSATIESDVEIGPNVVVEDRALVGAESVVGKGAKILADTVVPPGTIIPKHTEYP